MWSGPRNLSTALMRSFGNRADTVVVDEPFYAHYLVATGLPHPGRDEVIAHHEADWRRVADRLHAPLPEAISVQYQKHMAHHLLPTMERAWLDGLTHAFLLRNPTDMLRSLGNKLEQVQIEDTGLPQQLEIFEMLSRERGCIPAVLDADDLLEDPQGVLQALCNAIGITFDAAMLHWPAGRRATDGVWAKYWYDTVERSTSFVRWPKTQTPLPVALAALEREAKPLYATMHRHRLRPAKYATQ
ncbi:MAG: HAD family hydrolase [Gammaproteobacteria bacterium]|jgi:hypothetical protein|nr:HAD family hydrolase [Gammaproteobacteria bacterium]